MEKINKLAVGAYSRGLLTVLVLERVLIQGAGLI